MSKHIGFIGGGNMASALIGGLIKRGLSPSQIHVVEPFADQRAKLEQDFHVITSEAPGAFLSRSQLIVWAVKPQIFKEAAEKTRVHTPSALHLSVAAGIRSSDIAAWLGTERVVRAMPNTPALIGKGITALFARPAVSDADRVTIESVIQTTGELLWMTQEEQLDAVTALSGSGPAYVFYFLEAMIHAGMTMGLGEDQARKLAISTFEGASALAASSPESPEDLRARVTSKGGTTYAAIASMEESDIKQQFMHAIQAARQRATELGDEFGNNG